MAPIPVHGGLYDGTVLDDEFPHPYRAFLVRGRGYGAIYNIDGTPHPDGPVQVKVRYELAQTIGGRLVYVPVDFYAVKEDTLAGQDTTEAGADERDHAAGGADPTGDRAPEA